MANEGDVFTIPQFVEARSRQDLLRAMLLNNLKHGIQFSYFDLQKDGKVWVAWFYLSIDRRSFIVEEINSNG